MIRTENPNFVASINAPSQQEVAYWIDLSADPDGKLIKVYKDNKWVSITGGESVTEARVQELISMNINSLVQTVINPIGELAMTASSNADTAMNRLDSLEPRVEALENATI